jgi:hypothetical protein
VVSAADTLTFEAGTTQTVGGKLTLRGAAGRLLSLRSSAPGTQWGLGPLGAPLLAFVDVQDAHNGAVPLRAIGSLDSGNNTGWTFAEARARVD